MKNIKLQHHTADYVAKYTVILGDFGLNACMHMTS